MRHDPIADLKQQLRAELVRELRGWNAADIAYRLRTHPSRVSNLRGGRVDRFSLEMLIRYVTRLGRRVELITHKREWRASD